MALKIMMSAVATPTKLEVKKPDGGAANKTQELSLRVADADKAKGLVHRYVTLVQQNKRQGNASTKTRAEVRGGGKKPFAQKGTGNARRGSRTSPLIKGGGVAFGPRPRDWTISMNKKERRLAMATALQSAAPSLTVVEDITSSSTGKTKELVTCLQGLGADPMCDNVLLILNGQSELVSRAGKNVERLTVHTADRLNVYNILRADKIVVEQAGLQYIQEFYGPTEQRATEAAA